MKHSLTSRWLSILAWSLPFLPTPALADQPRRLAEPRILADSATDRTQVVDAFDELNDFDLHISLAFRHSTRRAALYRETAFGEAGRTASDTGHGLLDVASYVESTNRLIPSMDIGLHRDVALRLRLPVILSNVRRLDERGSSSQGGTEAPPALAGLPGEQLFAVPFRAPTRSGIEYLAVGLDVGITNQYRHPSRPTWVIGLEARFNVSEPLRACNASQAATTTPSGEPTEQVVCAHPSDMNRDGIADPRIDPEHGRPLEGTFVGGRRPGVSRGTTALEAHTYISKRIKYLEPYAGLSGLVEFPTSSSDFETDLRSFFSSLPPLRGSLVLGSALVPWEVRENFQRIAVDVRLRGTYVSSGRDYSELFDALGSSSAPSLRSPNFVGSQANPSARRVDMTGITEVQEHTEVELSGQFTWQAGEYVKLDAGAAFRVIQGHLITLGTPGPDYRSVIDDPGNRFRVGTSYGGDGWVRASVMF